MMRQFNSKPTRSDVWRRFLADDSGATAIEYGLLVAGIGLTIMGTVSATGQAIKNDLYGQIANALSTMMK
jgi:pilus assembly protein Flp/PilA